MIRNALPFLFLCSIAFGAESAPPVKSAAKDADNYACVDETTLAAYSNSPSVTKMISKPVKVKPATKLRTKKSSKQAGYSMTAVRKNLNANGFLLKPSKEEVDSYYDDESAPGPSENPAPGTLPAPRAAKDAGPWLENNGFVNLLDCPKYGLSMNDPKNVPKGAIIVYAGGHLGQIEIKTASGFWSDKPRTGENFAANRKVMGIYIKPNP